MIDDIASLVNHSNIAEELDEDTLKTIGRTIRQGFDEDEGSLTEWRKRYEAGLEKALQIASIKNDPWPGASNVKFPLLTLASLQFHARAFPMLVPTDGVVVAKILGLDPLGLKFEKARRVHYHMNYQLLDQMEHWSSDMDRLLITVPITGTEFKKTYYSPELERNVSEHVFGKDLVVNYFTKNLESSPRKTHIISITKNELEEKIRAGIYLEQKYVKEPEIRQDETTRIIDSSKGLQAPSDTTTVPLTMLECHCYWDFDGDGYEEPYIITIEKDSMKVARIVARFDKEGIKQKSGKIVKISPIEYFTKYEFIPSPDGGFYGLGFIHLVGALGDAVDTLINQLIDAGSLANSQSGFLSRSFKQRGGDLSFRRGEWKIVNATGQDMSKGIMPLPTKEPSGVLFNLLTLLIEYGQRITSTTDIMVGENPGQNQKATTTVAVVENGQKVFTAVYKRIRAALSQEFIKLFNLNYKHFDVKEYSAILGVEPEAAYREDYNSKELKIVPSADPNASSLQLKAQQAQALLPLIQLGLPADVIIRRYLQAMEIDNIEEFQLEALAQRQGQPAPEFMLKMQELQLDVAKFQHEQNIDIREQMRKDLETRIKSMEVGLNNIAKGKELSLEAMKIAVTGREKDKKESK